MRNEKVPTIGTLNPELEKQRQKLLAVTKQLTPLKQVA